MKLFIEKYITQQDDIMNPNNIKQIKPFNCESILRYISQQDYFIYHAKHDGDIFYLPLTNEVFSVSAPIFGEFAEYFKDIIEPCKWFIYVQMHTKYDQIYYDGGPVFSVRFDEDIHCIINKSMIDKCRIKKINEKYYATFPEFNLEFSQKNIKEMALIYKLNMQINDENVELNELFINFITNGLDFEEASKIYEKFDKINNLTV